MSFANCPFCGKRFNSLGLASHRASCKRKQIFVFGSNTQGRHGKGAALTALKRYGAIYGQSKGLQGQSYAIVTKDLKRGKRSVTLSSIYKQIQVLKEFAVEHPKLTFNISEIGCGLAGFNVSEIAPMFVNMPRNVRLNHKFQVYLEIQLNNIKIGK